MEGGSRFLTQNTKNKDIFYVLENKPSTQKVKMKYVAPIQTDTRNGNPLRIGPQSDDGTIALAQKNEECPRFSEEAQEDAIILDHAAEGKADEKALNGALQHKSNVQTPQPAPQGLSTKNLPPSGESTPPQQTPKKRSHGQMMANIDIGLQSQKKVTDFITEYNKGQLMDQDIILDLEGSGFKDIRDKIGSEFNNTGVDSGSFGDVVRMKRNNGKQVVVKRMKQGTLVNPNEVLTPYAHPGKGLVKVLGVMFMSKELFIVMEDAGQTLKRWLRDSEFLEWMSEKKNLLCFAYQLFQMLKYLELQEIVHRDIKTENVCITQKDGGFVPTLIDFGSAQTSQDKEFLAGHTPEFLPSELNKIIRSAREAMEKGESTQALKSRVFYSEKCDVWAMAILMITVILKGQHPILRVNYYKQSTLRVQRDQVIDEIICMPDKYFDHLMTEVPEPLRKALQGVLQVNREKRWSAREVCRHLEQEVPSLNARRKHTSNDDEVKAKPSPAVAPCIVGRKASKGSSEITAGKTIQDLTILGITKKRNVVGISTGNPRRVEMGGSTVGQKPAQHEGHRKTWAISGGGGDGHMLRFASPCNTVTVVANLGGSQRPTMAGANNIPTGVMGAAPTTASSSSSNNSGCHAAITRRVGVQPRNDTIATTVHRGVSGSRHDPFYQWTEMRMTTDADRNNNVGFMPTDSRVFNIPIVVQEMEEAETESRDCKRQKQC